MPTSAGDRRQITVALGLTPRKASDLAGFTHSKLMETYVRRMTQALKIPPIGANNVHLDMRRDELLLDWWYELEKGETHKQGLARNIQRMSAPEHAKLRAKWGIEELVLRDTLVPAHLAPSRAPHPLPSRPSVSAVDSPRRTASGSSHLKSPYARPVRTATSEAWERNLAAPPRSDPQTPADVATSSSATRSMSMSPASPTRTFSLNLMVPHLSLPSLPATLLDHHGEPASEYTRMVEGALAIERARIAELEAARASDGIELQRLRAEVAGLRLALDAERRRPGRDDAVDLHMPASFAPPVKPGLHLALANSTTQALARLRADAPAPALLPAVLELMRDLARASERVVGRDV